MIVIPMSEEQFAAARAKLAPHGLDLSAPSGVISRQGVTAAYTYAGDELRIEIQKHPVFLPVSLIESKLREWIESALGGLPAA